MASGDRYGYPEYDLRDIQQRVRDGRYRMAVRAANDASRLGLADSVVQCVCALKPARIRDGGNFHKSMLAKRAPAIAQGLWQDVYLIDWEDELLYVKLHVGRNGLVAIISFHENDDSGKKTE